MVKVFFAETFQISFRSLASNQISQWEFAPSINRQVSDLWHTLTHTRPNTDRLFDEGGQRTVSSWVSAAVLSRAVLSLGQKAFPGGHAFDVLDMSTSG